MCIYPFLYGTELIIALKRKSHPSQSESRNKRTTIDLNNQSESDSEWYYEDSVESESVKELHSEFPREEVDIFNAPKIEHRKTYELFWCQDFYTRIHSALLDSSSSEYQYRDEIVNILLASIFYDVEDALWTKTKQQRNFIKQENERERLGDKHDGILYMNVRGVKVGVGFIEVADNAFNTITSDKNDDLEKLLKDSGLNLLHVGDIVKIVKKFKIRMIKYCHKLIQEPRIATRHTISGLPTLHKKNQNE
ncbi:13514_t:CDS:2 [Entrophospora sp. SA101]|nr:13514_t:CDS:2 [Entrophospora sp. SA101]